MTAALLVAALVVALATYYVHVRLGAFIKSRTGSILLRVGLVTLGVAIGVLLVTLDHDESPTLLFLLGVGCVHLPAAFVLMLKSTRGEGPS